MAEEETIFDPSLKKKKKKKTGFNIDAALSEAPVAVIESPSPQENGVTTDIKDDTPDLDDIDLLGKKKAKKKKKPFNLDDLSSAVSDIRDGDEGADEGGGLFAVADFDELNNMDFSKQLKKKKKKPKGKLGLTELLADDEVKDEESREAETGESWIDTDRDYTYDELLQRAFVQLRERNPDLAAGEKKKLTVKPPQVVRIGSKKTAFANFTEICRLLHRMPKHLLLFLLAELGTSGSIDGNSQLIIKGRFQQKQIEIVLRRYIKEYVSCHTCKSPNTILQKEARLYFLQCEQCNSRCSVAVIKSGFQAVANKQQRQAIRANKK